MIGVSISDCSVFSPPSDVFVVSSLSVGTPWPAELRDAYRGAFSGFWAGSGGSAVCAGWLASRSTSGGAIWLASYLLATSHLATWLALSWADLLATCLASYLLAGWVLACLASYSPSWVWIGFFAGTALAFLAPVFLRCEFTEPAKKALTDSATTMAVLCCCAAESWLKKETSKSAKTHTA